MGAETSSSLRKALLRLIEGNSLGQGAHAGTLLPLRGRGEAGAARGRLRVPRCSREIRYERGSRDQQANPNSLCLLASAGGLVPGKWV